MDCIDIVRTGIEQIVWVVLLDNLDNFDVNRMNSIRQNGIDGIVWINMD